MRCEHLVEARPLMGTRFEILLPGSDSPRLLAAAEEALNVVERLEAQLSIYRYDSELSGINAFAAAGPVRVEPQLFDLLLLARDASRRTGGAFDPTVQPLLRAWGFLGGSGRPPEPDELAAARERTGFHLVELDPETTTIRFLREGVGLDLGAIGKGYAIDRAVEALREIGIRSGLIHAGTSTVYALGAPPEEAGWRVALRDPLGGPEEVFGEALLRDAALSVSAPHGKAFREGERLYGHVLDPRSGEPTRAALAAAVIHPSATLSDALSTALLVLGPAGLSEVAAEYPEAALLVVTEAEGALRFHTAGPADAWRLPGYRENRAG